MIVVNTYRFKVTPALAVAGWFAIGLATSTAAPAAAQTYTITDLGTLDGGPFTQAFGVHGNAQVVGRSALKTTVPGTGQIVGWAQTTSDATHAFSYSRGKMVDLGAYNFDTVAEAVNSSGVIV